ncbi:MAG TPA: FecR family protein [Pelobium sp.]|nr:FecR family protein [Pelobium sp.]
MQKDRLSYLLNQYISNSLSNSEQEELDNWYHSLNANKEEFDLWVAEMGGQENLTDSLYSNFQNNYLPKKQHKIFTLQRISIAATLLAFLSFGAYFLNSKKDSATQQPIAKTIKIEPGSNKATLTLANGSTIDLNERSNGELVDNNILKISKRNNGEIFYEMKESGQENTGYNMVSTPKGGKFQIVLSDGTRVWLNAASSLKYPVKFAANERKVELTGEAYFEVAHNKSSPFKVLSDAQVVNVLGTHFNINGYQDDQTTKTTLFEGSVSVQSQLSNKSKVLTPGKQAVLSENTLKIQNADLKEAIAWKEGFFKFNDLELHMIMNQIARWYDVDVVYQDNVKNKKFVGYISRAKNINEILNLLQATKSVKFKIEGRKVIVMT